MERETEHRSEERAVRISAGAIELEGNLGVVEGAEGVVLFAHGSGSGRSSPRNLYVADEVVEPPRDRPQVLRRHAYGVLVLEDGSKPLPVLHQGVEPQGDGNEQRTAPVRPARDVRGVAAVGQGEGHVRRCRVAHGPEREVPVLASVPDGVEVRGGLVDGT